MSTAEKRQRNRTRALGEPRAAQPLRSAWVHAALICVLCLLVVLTLRQVGSLDAGFHLAVGRSILEDEGWPEYDRFSYTMAEHRYVDTSWGYQVLLALADRAGGAPAMVLFQSALVVATFVTVFLTAVRTEADRVYAVLLSLLAVLASELRFQVRPELLSYALLALLLALLHRHAEGRRAPLWTLVPLFLLWANGHSLFVLGWVALACFLLGCSWQARRFDTRLAGWSLAAVAVTFVNPYGWRGVAFPFTLATRLDPENPFAQTIGEFESPFSLAVDPTLPFRPHLALWSFRALFVLAVVSVVWSLLRRRHAAALVAVPFLVVSAAMVRNMPLLVVACLPGVVWMLSEFGARRRGKRVRQIERMLVLATAIVAVGLSMRVVTDAHYVASRRVDRFGLGWNRITEPVESAAFLEQAALPGRMLNHLNFGGYLMHARDEPVFIDGRLEVVGERFFEAYRRALSSPAELERAVERWGIGWIVFPYATNRTLLQMLSDDARWRLVYFDHLAAVFARADAVQAASVDSGTREALAVRAPLELDGLPGVDLPREPRLVGWVRGFVERQRFPTDDHNRGLFHYYRRDPQRAADHFAKAVRSSGGRYWELYQNLGAALRRLGATEQALACYRIVADAVPGNPAIAERVRELDAASSH